MATSRQEQPPLAREFNRSSLPAGYTEPLHADFDGDVVVTTKECGCLYKFAIGSRKGQPCGKPRQGTTDFCGYHQNGGQFLHGPPRIPSFLRNGS